MRIRCSLGISFIPSNPEKLLKKQALAAASSALGCQPVVLSVKENSIVITVDYTS